MSIKITDLSHSESDDSSMEDEIDILLQAGSPYWCKFRQPPPLPHHSSRFYNRMYSFIKSNSTHWDNFLYYHNTCGIALPEDPIIAKSKESANAGVTIVIALLIVFTVLLAVGFIWWRVKHRRGSTHLVALPLKEYETTNYLDNKARNNQCWNKHAMQEPDQSANISAGSLDRTNSNDNKVIVYVEPNSDTLTDKLFLSNSLKEVNQSSESRLDVTGCQNLCFMSDNEESKSPVSPGASSLSPLFDNIDGVLLPNVPEMRNSLPNDKQGNMYTSFPEVNKSDNSDMVSEGPLPPISATDPINTRDSNSSVSSPKKRKSSLVNRKSEPVIERQMELICDDLMENRKSV